MNLEELRELCQLMKQEGLVELAIEEEGRKVHLRLAAEGHRLLGGKEPEEVGTELIRSPVVGTFWRRPAPEEEPFVKVGDEVEPGQVLCVVEAMKVMNEVRADRAGVVEEILVEDGQPVEYGQPLFRLRPRE